MKHGFMRPLIALLLLLSLVGQGTWVLAGTTGSLSGTVVDAEGKAPLAGVKVSAVSPSQSATTSTDAGGRFGFLSLAPDTYTLSVEKQGFDPTSTAGVTVFADQAQTLQLTTRKALRTIGRVSARSNSDLVKPGTTADLYSVNAVQQAAVQGLGGGGSLNSGYSAIASVPGTFIPQGQSSWAQSVFVRGGNYTQVGYEYDGVPIQRSFDQYPGNSLSNLGQQELQVYTGAQPVNSQSSAVAGFVNQVIKTGTFPGFATADIGLGTPTFYHKASFEVGGATPNRNFSYYAATSGYDQEFRYCSQFNCAENNVDYGTPYAQVAAGCGTPSATAGCYTGPVGPNGYALGPAIFGAENQFVDRESVVNLHFGLPHHGDGGKDDIQLLYDNSLTRQFYQANLNDWGSSATNVLNGTSTYDGVFYPSCGAVAPGVDCTAASQPAAHYLDRTIYTGPVGTTLTAASLNQVSPYYFPYSSHDRAPGAAVPSTQRDSYDNRSSIFKVQYQKNFSSNAYLRLYGYTFYSDWLQNGAQGLGSVYAASITPDYEIASHTRGVSMTFADQLNPQNLINLTGGYTFANTVRWNNAFPSQNNPIALLVDSTNPTNGMCYSYDGAMTAPVFCASPSAAGYKLPALAGSGVTQSGLVTRNATDPSVTAASGLTCGSGPCEYFTVGSGLGGSYNSVAPAFLNVSLEDSYKPTDRLLVNLGLHYDGFRYNLSDTSAAAGPLPQAASAAARQLFVNSYNTFRCSSIATGVVPATGPGTCPAGTSLVSFSAISPSSVTYHDIEPRIGATYTVDPLTVLRASYGKYDQPTSTAFQQYNRAQPDIAAYDVVQFYKYGFTTPAHYTPPEISYNTDFSLEHQFKGTDASFKLTPFYRKTHDENINVVLDPITNFSTGIDAANATVRGLEFLFRKGDFNRNGFAGQLSYTYTYGTFKYLTLPGGGTALDNVNNAVKNYNAYTSACAPGGKAAGSTLCGTTTSGNAASACYTTGGAATACGPGTVANPYWNDTPHSLFDPNADYLPYNQTLSSGLSNASSSYVVPHVASFVLNYKHDKFAVTPTVQFSAGGRYGSPVSGSGIAPDTCTGALAGAATTDPRYAALFGAPPGGGSGYDAQTCGGMTAPNFFTKQFDNLGTFVEPSQLSMNVQMGYDLSRKVRLNVLGVNIFNQCFGGTTAAWAVAGPKVGCWYNAPFAYVGNAYNPGNPIQKFVAYPYAPTFGNVAQQAYGFQANPFQLFVNLSAKI